MKGLVLCISLVFAQMGAAQGLELDVYFPIKLFFANDEPNSRSVNTTTNLTYTQTYQSYQTKFQNYLNQGEQFSYLLDGDIKPNYNKLNGLKKVLLDSLNAGSRIILTVKGFASPLHLTDYNVFISQRRIATFINELKQVPGIYNYINTNQLTMEELPFGEYSAHSSVNDQLDSTHLSVHHLQASYERRVEVELTSITSPKEALLHSEVSYANVGKVKRGAKVTHTFEIQNLGLDTLSINQIAVSCGCSVANADLTELNSQEKTLLKVNIDTEELATGKQVKSITVLYNDGQMKRYTLLLEVFE